MSVQGMSVVILQLLLVGNMNSSMHVRITSSITTEAQSDLLWTGVSINDRGEVAVCFPRWGFGDMVSVAFLEGDSSSPYPDSAWNSWRPDESFDSSFVCVQSICFDEIQQLWVLDTGNPWLAGILPGACRLFCFGTDGRLELVYTFPDSVLYPDSYLNDFRLDQENGFAYLTDSGRGSLVVLDLDTAEAWRILDGHPFCMSDGTHVEVQGIAWRFGEYYPDVHSDGIALSPGAEWLYWHSLTGSTLYRIPAFVLSDDSMIDDDIQNRVEAVCSTGPVDGMIFDSEGNLYLSLLCESAVGYLPHSGDSVIILAQDPLLKWPDTFALVPGENRLMVTCSRIHEGSSPSGPYSLYSFSSAMMGQR